LAAPLRTRLDTQLRWMVIRSSSDGDLPVNHDRGVRGQTINQTKLKSWVS
jgi:hypothetical protein